MPVLLDRNATALPIKLGASLPLELFWLSLTIVQPGTEPIGAALRRRVDAFWNDGEPGLPEVLVLAERAGLLPGTELRPLLDALPTVTAIATPPRLSVETDQSREAIRSRLDQLRREPARVADYARLLTDLWDAGRSAWETTGQAEALEASDMFGARLGEGTTVGELIPHKRPWRADIEAAAVDGTLVVAHSYFAPSWVFFDLDTTFLVGVPVRGDQVIESLRQAAVEPARSLKVLADPTRLAILAHLARCPASITETARSFKIAQPTASAHFRALRDARLLVESREAGRTYYAVDQARLQAILSDAAATVMGTAS
ncbi:MAG: metalloregulator ArsR/SmtB family transcription factor [Candidatus Dormiibacterota bacterium]